MLSESDVAQAFVRACELDVEAIKPGNVSRAAPGHGMQADDFVRSAYAAAPFIADVHGSIGHRILNAVRATRAAVACNTNLGIVLLCSPLAASIDGGLPAAMAALTVDDACAAFEAIRLAKPGGLGEAARHDVRAPPTVGLREAMVAAADRDLIARQYAEDFADVMHWGLPCLRQIRRAEMDPAHAMSLLYLAFLRRAPDTHVARKHGLPLAIALQQEAIDLTHSWGFDRYPGHDTLLAWDAALKGRGVNPGATADLCVATWFALYLEDGGK